MVLPMFTRSPTDARHESGDPLPGPSTAGRKITLTETCDLAPFDVSDESAPLRRFGLLVFCDGEAQLRLFEEGATAVVGREPPCEIVVRDASISRQHARFSMKDGEVWVEDLDSRNGTFLRGRRVQREQLRGGDEVDVGRARLVLVATRPPEAPGSRDPSARALDEHVVRNARMKKVYEDAVRGSRTNLPVLILGETGAGKEHVATTLHRSGDRRNGPLVVLNCAAIPPSLLEITLFGHERSASTGAGDESIGLFEKANGGILFLDEIGELAPGAQAALLRAIETHRISRVGSSAEIAIDVRIVAATHCDLKAMIDDGTFRQDLYFRLNGLTLEVPPLREREDEIEPLVDLFVERTRKEWGTGARRITPEAKDALRRFHWPGNVRQLRYAVERAALLCAQDEIGVSDLPDYVFSGVSARQEPPFTVGALPDLALRLQMSKFERALIEEALRRVAGNRRAAAKLLRVPVRTLFRRLRTSSDGEVSEDT